MTINRRRPHVTLTPAPETLAALRDVGRETGLHSLGVILDYVMTDYIRLKVREVFQPAIGDPPDEAIHP